MVCKKNNRGSPDEEAVTLNECLQLCFHRSCRHHLMLLYPREMLILDLEINQTVGIIALDRSSSPFTMVSPLNVSLGFVHDGIMTSFISSSWELLVQEWVLVLHKCMS